MGDFLLYATLMWYYYIVGTIPSEDVVADIAG